MPIVVDVRKRGTAGPDWSRAACLEEDPELFFPVGTGKPALEQTREAQVVCAGCPVREQCRSWAVETRQEYGVWGGLSEQELQDAQQSPAARRRQAHRVARAGAAA